MKNFDIYDPMKRGQGLVLDGQTLAHIEVSGKECRMPIERSNHFYSRYCSITKVPKKARYCSFCLGVSHPLVRRTIEQFVYSIELPH